MLPVWIIRDRRDAVAAEHELSKPLGFDGPIIVARVGGVAKEQNERFVSDVDAAVRPSSGDI
jgi:hypothetical protein